MYNLGIDVGLAIKAARRLVICPTYDDSQTVNKIAISSLVSNQLPIAVLQTLYDTWWHTDTNNKMMATPQLSEFTFTDNDPVKSESEWYSRTLQDGTRDVSFVFNDVVPRVIKQFALNMGSGQYSFYIITNDDRLIGKFDGAYIVPFEIMTNTLYVGPKKLPGYAEHAKDVVTFRMNEARSMDDACAIPISGGYVTSDDDHWSLIDATCTPSSPTANGVVLTIVKTARNPETGEQEVVTGIAYDEVVAAATGDTESPAASENWVEDPDGTYTWTETSVFGSGTYTVKISTSKIDVAEVTFTVT
jgi:hypothetical protein